MLRIVSLPAKILEDVATPEIVVEDNLVHIYTEHYEVQFDAETWKQLKNEIDAGIDEEDKTKVVRFWEGTEDGDASAEGILKENFTAYEAGGGPEYTGYVKDRAGKEVYVTIN